MDCSIWQMLYEEKLMITYYENVMDVLGESVASIPVEEYERLIGECVDALKNGGKIIASGLGKNVPICEKFVGTMNSMGLDARFLHTNTAVHGDLGMVMKNDIVLLLSKGGNTIETVTLANYLKERGTNTWLLTFSKNSKSAEVVDNKMELFLENEGDEWDIMPNNSTSVYLILLQGMAVEIGKRMGVQVEGLEQNCEEKIYGISHVLPA